MRLALTPDQVHFRRTVRDLLAAECPPDAVRRGPDRGRWRALARIGATGLTVPERYGGLGLGARELVPVLEEAGYACLPEPLTAAAAAAEALAGADPAAAERWLPRLVAGEAVLTLAVPPDPYPQGAAFADLVLFTDDTLSDAARPDAARSDATAACALHALRGGLPGPAATVDPTLAARPLPTPRRGAPPATAPASALRRAFHLGALGTAAHALGAARRMLDLAVAHARLRHQFGRPIGSFQAVKHRLADVLRAIEFARPPVFRAAWSLDHRLASHPRDVSMAKVLACEAAESAARASLQVHGAIGHTEECDLHLWLRRAWALTAAWGDTAHHRAAIAADLLGPSPAPPAPER
ncbi:acyl-CoA dehydrogenase family protein [Streptomyces capparidis]